MTVARVVVGVFLVVWGVALFTRTDAFLNVSAPLRAASDSDRARAWRLFRRIGIGSILIGAIAILGALV